jgi:hypothetical protein
MSPERELIDRGYPDVHRMVTDEAAPAMTEAGVLSVVPAGYI